MSLPSAKSQTPAAVAAADPVRGSAGQPSRRADIDRRSIVCVRAGEAVKKFVAYGFADDGRAGIENSSDRGCVPRRRLVCRKPLGISTTGARTGNVVHVLDRGGQARKRPTGRALDGCGEIVRNEERSCARAGHWL